MKDENSKEPLPLGYLAPQDDLELRKRCQGQRFGGAVIACVTVIMAVAIFFLGSLELIHTTVPRTPRDQMIVVLSSTAPLCLLFVVTAYQYFRHGRRWFVQGVLIGIGIAALMEGVCFGFLI